MPYKITTIDGDRYADFHALQHRFLSALAAAGVGVKELQELARYSDPRITLGIYTHARAESLSSAVGRLQIPGSPEENPLARLTRAEVERMVGELQNHVAKLQAHVAEFEGVGSTRRRGTLGGAGVSTVGASSSGRLLDFPQPIRTKESSGWCKIPGGGERSR